MRRTERAIGRRIAPTLLLIALAAAAAPGVATGSTAKSTAPAKPPTCGDHRTITRGGHKYLCSFDDEFNASTGDAHKLDRSKWLPQLTSDSGYYTGPVGDQACYVDTPKTISVSKGTLHLSARRSSAPFDCKEVGSVGGVVPIDTGFTTRYIAGEVTTDFHFSQTYGRFAVRAKLPQTMVKGLQETLWLWPVNDVKYGGDEASGEIDFAEFYSQYANDVIPYIHYSKPPLTSGSSGNTNVVTGLCSIDRHTFNTYVAQWKPGQIALSVNGKVCLIDNYKAEGLKRPAPFNQPFFLALTQALGVATNAFNPATTPLPATTLIDYVRVWQQSG